MLAKIEEMWKKSPQLRLGQLLGNCAKSELKLYYMEDEELLKRMETMYKDVDKD